MLQTIVLFSVALWELKTDPSGGENECNTELQKSEFTLNLRILEIAHIPHFKTGIKPCVHLALAQSTMCRNCWTHTTLSTMAVITQV